MKTKNNLSIFLTLLTICLLAAAWISYLTIDAHIKAKVGITQSSFCNINQEINCSKVIESEWSEFLGLPLGVYGIIFYLGILWFVIQSLLTGFWKKEDLAKLIFPSTLAASTLSIFLFAISKFVIGAICPLCLGLYTINFAMFFLCWIFIPGKPAKKISAVINTKKNEIKRFLQFRIGNAFHYLLIFCALGLIAISSIFIPKKVYSHYLSQVENQKWEDQHSAENISVNLTEDAWGDYYFGNKNAKIQIVEFADFECPFCKHLGNNLKNWLKPYEGKFYFVFKNYPLDKACNQMLQQDFHKSACYLANLARCAGEQDKFWETYEALNNLPENLLNKHDKILNEISATLDQQALKECVKSERQIEYIKKDIDAGNQLQITGTPAIFINGKKVEYLSQESITGIMDSLVR